MRITGRMFSAVHFRTRFAISKLSSRERADFENEPRERRRDRVSLECDHLSQFLSACID